MSHKIAKLFTKITNFMRMDGSRGPLVIPPIAFSRVADKIYRSAYPAPKAMRFIESLQLKSIVALAPGDIKKELREYCTKRDIAVCECSVGLNQEPFVTMSEKSVAEAVDFMSDPRNHPILVFCTTGRSKTSVVVGCYRRRIGWSLASVFSEYEMFMDPDSGLADMTFIETFQMGAGDGVPGGNG